MAAAPARSPTTSPWLAVTALAVALAACAPDGDPDLEVSPGQAAVPVAGSSQVVLEITNRGDGDDTLVEAETPAAVGADFHLTAIDDGRATMRELVEVALPAGETVRFRPGGLHLMLFAPDELAVGDTFPLTLRFDRSDAVTVEVAVVELLDLAESELAETDPDP